MYPPPPIPSPPADPQSHVSAAVTDTVLPPMISLTDKFSIFDIRNDIQSLNSSIQDLVASLIGANKLVHHVISKRKNMKAESPSILLQSISLYANRKIDTDLRYRLYEIVILDVVYDFVFNCTQGEGFGDEYKSFCRWTELMEQKEESRETRYWRHRFSGIVDHPPPETWEHLTKQLIKQINDCLSKFLKRSAKKSHPYVDTNEQITEALQAAYTLMMKMRGGVLSQTLKLILGEKDRPVDLSQVEMERGQPLEVSLKAIKLSGLRDSEYLVLGNRGFGLVGTSEDGRWIHLKPLITPGKIVLK